uniref:Serpentine receptor class gamma n=1 Tax=Caenorhabditis japonica TaxID=281687 RepID=A0A8R1E406_CAEJA
MASYSNDTSYMPFQCSQKYDSLLESLKYVGSVIYLIPAAFMHFAILRVILITEREYYGRSSFYQLFAVDSVASLVLILWDIFFSRLLLFVPPFCPIVSSFFFRPTLLQKVYYVSGCHARFAKSVAQIFMVLNRMNCVVTPTFYGKIWERSTKWAILLVILLPLAGTWNVILSRVYAFAAFGGFGFSYIRYVQWVTFMSLAFAIF